MGSATTVIGMMMAMTAVLFRVPIVLIAASMNPRKSAPESPMKIS
jgi:hypothetical protein